MTDEELLQIARDSLVQDRADWTGFYLCYGSIITREGKVEALTKNKSGSGCHAPTARVRGSKTFYRYLTSVYYDRNTMKYHGHYDAKGLSEEQNLQWIEYVINLPHVRGCVANPDAKEIYHTGIIIDLDKSTYAQLLFLCKALRMNQEEKSLIEFWLTLVNDHQIHPVLAHYAASWWQTYGSTFPDRLIHMSTRHSTHMGMCIKEEDFADLFIEKPISFPAKYLVANRFGGANSDSRSQARADSANKLIVEYGVSSENADCLKRLVKPTVDQKKDGWGGMIETTYYKLDNLVNVLRLIQSKYSKQEEPVTKELEAA